MQPLAYWEFRDCFAYAAEHNVGLHPLHEQGYPSLGDVHSTLPVERSKWFEYGAERSGRFQGLTNPDGSKKTECGARLHLPLVHAAASQ
jgi:phosphoadenosine phosphosulfate reductase